VKKLIAILLGLIFLAAAGPVQAEETVVFEQSDPVGDDYGPGSYIYPTGDQFAPYEGLFDITSFKVTSEEDSYYFYFDFVRVTNPWQAKYDFSHQLIQVYIDNQDGGQTKPFKPGANVRFESQHPWNKLVKITGWSLELYSPGDKADKEQRLETGKVDLIEKTTVKVAVPKEELGELEKAHYYVLIGSLDGFGYDNYRQVASEAADWKFGGGTDTDINPNVLDTLVPEGMKQKQVLGGYDEEEGKLATLRAVGPELSLPLKFIVIFGFILVLIFSLAGVGIKFVTGKLGSH
jgi:carbohydrate-binding DOMON domain-containing protein